MKEKMNSSNTIRVGLLDAKRGMLNIIDAGTGTGKTYTILTADHWNPESQVLFLVSRKAIKDSVVQKYDVSSKTIKKNGKNIYVSTYHDFMYYRNGAPDGRPWDYVICDEFHALFRDGSYSEGFALTIRWVEELVTKGSAIVIGMSATMDTPRFYFGSERVQLDTDTLVKIHTYNTPHAVRVGFGGTSMANDLVGKGLAASQKILVYSQDLVQNETNAKVIGPHAISICSDYAKPIRDQADEGKRINVALINKEQKDFIIQEEKFPDGVEIVFSTNATIEGININPERQVLDAIIAQADDLDDIVQAAGRYRGQLPQFNVVMRNLNAILAGIKKKEESFVDALSLVSRYESIFDQINDLTLSNEERRSLLKQVSALSRQMGRHPMIDSLDRRDMDPMTGKETGAFEYELKYGYMVHLWRLKGIFEKGEDAVIEYLSQALQSPASLLTHREVKLEKAEALLGKMARDNLGREMPVKQMKEMIKEVKLTNEDNSHQMSHKRKVEILEGQGYKIENLGLRKEGESRLTFCRIVKI